MKLFVQDCFNNKKSCLTGLFIVFLLSHIFFPPFTFALPNKPITIAYFTPRADDYWKYTMTIAKAVAQDLNVNLKIYPAYNSPEKYLENIKNVLNFTGDKKVDGIIFYNYKQTSSKIIEMTEKAGIPAFGLASGFDLPVINLGKPREKYQTFIGDMRSDGEDSGFILANELIDQAKHLGMVDSTGKVHMVAITGNSYEDSSRGRVKGLQLAISKRDDVILHEILAGYWKVKKGKKRFQQLLNRYPETHVVWIANDSMGIGAIEALKEMGKEPGRHVLLSGMGTILQGLKPIMSGEYSVSQGGFFMIPGWIVLLFHDYLHGQDFAIESTVFLIDTHTFKKENSQRYFEIAGKDNWNEVDFSRFSKIYHPEMKKYNLGISAIIKQLQSKNK